MVYHLNKFVQEDTTFRHPLFLLAPALEPTSFKPYHKPYLVKMQKAEVVVTHKNKDIFERLSEKTLESGNSLKISLGDLSTPLPKPKYKKKEPLASEPASNATKIEVSTEKEKEPLVVTTTTEPKAVAKAVESEPKIEEIISNLDLSGFFAVGDYQALMPNMNGLIDYWYCQVKNDKLFFKYYTNQTLKSWSRHAKTGWYPNVKSFVGKDIYNPKEHEENIEEFYKELAFFKDRIANWSDIKETYESEFQDNKRLTLLILFCLLSELPAMKYAIK